MSERRTPKETEKHLDPEYDKLPLIENLQIHVGDDVIIEAFGTIIQQLDTLGINKKDLITLCFYFSYY